MWPVLHALCIAQVHVSGTEYQQQCPAAAAAVGKASGIELPRTQANAILTRIPRLGLGLYHTSPDSAYHIVRTALAAGYRHLDCAEVYGNNEAVGKAMRDSGIDRAEIFVTSKVSSPLLCFCIHCVCPHYAIIPLQIAFDHMGYNATREAISTILRQLDTPYLDLLLVHFPAPAARETGQFAAPSHVPHSRLLVWAALRIDVAADVHLGYMARAQVKPELAFLFVLFLFRFCHSLQLF